MVTKRERLEAILQNDLADRPPVAFWRHWPGDDQDALRLSEVTANYQHRFDWDFAKITPSSSFVAECWGAQTRYDASILNAERVYTSRPVVRAEDWDHIIDVGPSLTPLDRQVETARDLRQRLGPDIPVLMTLFTPLSTVRYLAGDAVYPAHMRLFPQKLHQVLGVITRTWQEFIQRISPYVDGLFLSSFVAAHSVMNNAEYQELGTPYDLQVLEAAESLWFNTLHLHSPFPMMELAKDYPVRAVNWDDRSTLPNLAEGKTITGKAVLGGIDQVNTLLSGSPEDVQAEAIQAIRSCDTRGVMLAGGCTYSPMVPEGNLLSARQIVDQLN